MKTDISRKLARFLTGKKKILIVDDDKAVAETLCTRLRREGFEVIQASNGEDGILKARTELPELIILDVIMPKLDGWATCKVLKQGGETRRIPVLVMSAVQHMEHSEKAFEAGANGFLNKPYTTDELMNKVQKFICEKN
jgi:DNA-binding response OmpR family regulator